MAINTRQKQILKTMGIPVWSAHRDIPGQKLINVDVLEKTPEGLNEQSVSNGSWELLQRDVIECIHCDLHQSRTNPVFGVGNKQASLMIIGEAPGVDEDLKGEPFVGVAGQLLNQMLFALGFSRDDVFITNILKCSSPDNRKPLKTEIEACSSHLSRQINLIKPKIILCLGAASAKSLLHSDERISDLRGRVCVHENTSTPLIATYHPAYLLRKPTEKRAVWNDLLLVKKQLSQFS